MNTQMLARYYDRLSPRERFPLIVAARSRGDEAEAQGLIRSAPTTLPKVVHYRGLAEAMGELSLLHLCQLLHLAALPGQAELRWLHSSRRRRGNRPDRRELQLLQDVCSHAYLFLVESEGWNRFCAELNLDPDVLVRDVPGYTTVKAAEKVARVLGYTPEEAAHAVRLQQGDTASVLTAETILAGYRKALAAREGS
jgi:hypothetical protein